MSDAPPEARRTPTSSATDVLDVGYLHVGRPESGVRRYGRIVAEGVGKLPGVTTHEVDAGQLEGGTGDAAAAARDLAVDDVIHLQWNRRGWGKGFRGAKRILEFRRASRRPLVVTLHDVFPERGPRSWFQADMLSMRLVAGRAARLVVHSDAEVGRLVGLVGAERVRVVPHFVEERHIRATSAEARASLGVEGRRIVTLLGFVYGRKGHAELLEAAAVLPPDVLVVFAGGPVAGREFMLDRLRERAAALGVGPDRLRVTGWLSEEDLETWVAATHLAVLPFRDMSASGSLSTWIAAGKPLLVSDLPGFREYEARVPGALRFVPRTGGGLAGAIRDALDSDPPDVDPKVLALRDDLTVERTAERYLAVYREAIAGR